VVVPVTVYCYINLLTDADDDVDDDDDDDDVDDDDAFEYLALILSKMLKIFL
jgi:hypothetical protein